MDRRYSIQPIIRKDSKEDEEIVKKLSAFESNRRGSVAVTNYITGPVTTYGKTRSWVKRSNLAPEHAKPYPETRSSWDESMRSRRDSDQGLRGIVLRKGFSDDSKNYSLFHTESRRASKIEPPFFYSGKRLSKWETVNLVREKSAAEEALAAVAGKRRGQPELKVLCSIPSGEDSGIDVASASTTSSALSSKFSHCYLDNVSESEERHDYYSALEMEVPTGSPGNLASPGLSRFDGQFRSNARPPPRDFDASDRYSKPTDRFPLEDSWSEESTSQDMTTDGQTRDNVPVHIRRDGPDERRPSIIPTLNITKEQSNFEKFLNIISTNKDIPEIGAIGEGSISRTKSCEMLRKEQEGDDMSIWERRNRKAGDFSPGTRPIVLNIEAMDDSMFWSKSGSSTLVSSSNRSETYICKDDLHLSLRKLSVASGGDPRSAGLCASDGNRLGGGDGDGRSGSRLRKPTNLWGVTRRISVKRKKVTKDEKKEEAPAEQSEEPPR